MTRKPEDLRYAKSHEWVEVDGEVATIGISAFAVAELTDLVFIALPQVGVQVKSGEEFGEVESVKAVSSLYSPVSGTVVEVNSALPDQLDSLSSDPYNAGWIIKVKGFGPSEVSSLMDYATYQDQCAG